MKSKKSLSKISKDLNKKLNLEQLGYTIYKLDTKSYYREQSVHNIKYYAELEEKIFDICNNISQIVLNKLSEENINGKRNKN